MGSNPCVAVFGLGYVGLVTSVCYANAGHEVVGVEKDATKLNRLRCGRPTISEPGVEDLLNQALASGALRVTDDVNEAVSSTDVGLICVGTPSTSVRGTDLTAVLAVTREIGGALRGNENTYTVVLRSTVPPGTTRDHVGPALSGTSERRDGSGLELYFHPEFLRQGTAIDDLRRPPFVVVGTHDGAPPPASSTLSAILRSEDSAPVVLNYQEAELLKIACNAFHALKIDFANEIGTVARHVDADPARVMEAFTTDKQLNISAAYLRPGFAFGGSCLPKEVRSLNQVAENLGLQLPVMQSILPSNDAHLERITRYLLDHARGTIGMVGITFKENTDDLRESAAMRLIERLREAGKDVIVYEPEIHAQSLLGSNLEYLGAVLPDYANRLVDWSTLHTRSSVILITRSGVVTDDELARVGEQVIDLDRLTLTSGPDSTG